MLAVSVVALIACGAFVMDVGAWMQGHRATQAVADASALAGAQALPLDTGLGDGDRARLLVEERRRRRRGRHPVRIEHVAERHDQGAREAHRNRLPFTRARRLVGQPHGGCGGTRVQPRRGDVRGAVRHRQERAVPLRQRLPVLQPADELRPRQGRPRRLRGHQHRRLPAAVRARIRSRAGSSRGSTRRCRSAGTTRTPGQSSRHRR